MLLLLFAPQASLGMPDTNPSQCQTTHLLKISNLRISRDPRCTLLMCTLSVFDINHRTPQNKKAPHSGARSVSNGVHYFLTEVYTSQLSPLERSVTLASALSKET